MDYHRNMRDILKKIQRLNEPKLIKIKEKAKRIVFVGDTHGDLEVSEKVIGNYLNAENKIVFLGDYVDRGPKSKENVDFLLKKKIEEPKSIYLLQGNHEGYPYINFAQASFWARLSEKEYNFYRRVFQHLPLAVSIREVLALHGAFPNVESLEQINDIEPGSKKWKQITWGDFVEKKGSAGFLGCSRPRFGKSWFLNIMNNLNKEVLIRSHQPGCPRSIFNDRCLTIFSSSSYSDRREIAILNMKQEVESTKDLIIKEI